MDLTRCKKVVSASREFDVNPATLCCGDLARSKTEVSVSDKVDLNPVISVIRDTTGFT